MGTLPLDDALVSALTALDKLQLREIEEAIGAYPEGLDVPGWFRGGEYVITDELGVPVHPQWCADQFG